MNSSGKLLPYLRLPVFLCLCLLMLALSHSSYAADASNNNGSNPTLWNKIFGGQEADKAQLSKSKSPKKKSPPKKASVHKNKGADSSAEQTPPSAPTPPPPAQAVNPDKVTPPDDISATNSPETKSTFFGRLFSQASSKSPDTLEPAQNTAPAIAPPQSTQTPEPTQAAASSSTDRSKVNETAEKKSSEGFFFGRLFSQASSKPPESLEAGNATPASPVAPVAPITPAATTSVANPETVSTQSPVAPNNESPSFWKSLFGSKSNSETRAKSAPEKASPAAITPDVLATPANPIKDLSPTKLSIANVCVRDQCSAMILFDAPINKASVDQFEQNSGAIPAGTIVLLNSTTGDLNSGIRLGQLIHQKHLNTSIGKTQLNKKSLIEVDGQCYSACILAFAGGISRRIDAGDQLGIYALRANSGKVSDAEFKNAIASISNYFDQMGVDRRLIDQMLQIKGASVSALTLNTAKLLNLDNSSRSQYFPWRMQALDDGLLIALVSEKQSSGRYVITLGLTRQSKDYRLTIFIKPVANQNLSQLSDYLSRSSRIQLSASGQNFGPTNIKSWEATNTGIQAAVQLSDKELSTLTSSLDFELDLPQANPNPFGLDAATTFGTAGLKGAITAMKR